MMPAWRRLDTARLGADEAVLDEVDAAVPLSQTSSLIV